MMHKFSTAALTIIALALILRLLGMLEYPLHDPTEARYAEIPRLIIETHNWIMPPFDYGVPFWGKPPLTFWMTAVSFELFGYSPFAARLPIFLLAVLMLWLTYQFAKCLQKTEKAAFSTLILLTTALFFIASGAVMTDMALCVCVCLSLMSFWQALHAPSPTHQKYQYLFFVGMGIGLLVKGPIVGILVLLPVISWIIIEKQWLNAWQNIPWFKGSTLMLMISVPWYIIAEIDSPGFINYFLVGEHFMRFVDSGWHGDLYGVAHKHPRGKIWLLWLFAAFPWSFIFLGSLLSWPLRHHKQQSIATLTHSSWHRYIFLWAITPMAFFSLSGNILYTYVLPGLPAFAILVTELLSLRFNIASIMKSKWLYANTIIPLVAIAFLVILYIAPEKLSFEKNQQILVERYNNIKTTNSRLSYLGRRLYSIDFHTQGRATRLKAEQFTLNYLHNNNIQDYIIMPQNEFSSLPQKLQNACDIVARYRKYILLKERT